MALTVEKLLDLVLATHSNRVPGKFNQIAQDAVSYPLINYITKKGNMIGRTGANIVRPLMTDLTNQHRMVGMYATDTVNVGDVMKQITSPWKHGNTPFAYDVKEVGIQGGPEEIISYMKIKEKDAELSRVIGLNNKLWLSPTSSADELSYWGVPFWVVINATTGFNGGNPTGFSDVGGINRSTVSKFRNYTAQYAAVSKADLIGKIVEGFAETGFESPVNIDDFKRGVTDRYKIFSPRSVIKQVEAIQEQQNDSLGSDAAPMFGKANINRTPLTREPMLEDTTKNPLASKAPVYVLDMAYWEFYYLKGFWDRRKSVVSPTQHDVVVTHIDDTGNLICTDPRRQAVYATA